LGLVNNLGQPQPLARITQAREDKIMNTQLDAVTFQATTAAYDNRYIAKLVAHDTEKDLDSFYAFGETPHAALLSLYWAMSIGWYSFKLQVVDNGQVVQELSYAEKH
jgi:hypothetical protein